MSWVIQNVTVSHIYLWCAQNVTVSLRPGSQIWSHKGWGCQALLRLGSHRKKLFCSIPFLLAGRAEAAQGRTSPLFSFGFPQGGCFRQISNKLHFTILKLLPGKFHKYLLAPCQEKQKSPTLNGYPSWLPATLAEEKAKSLHTFQLLERSSSLLCAGPG